MGVVYHAAQSESERKENLSLDQTKIISNEPTNHINTRKEPPRLSDVIFSSVTNTDQMFGMRENFINLIPKVGAMHYFASPVLFS